MGNDPMNGDIIIIFFLNIIKNIINKLMPMQFQSLVKIYKLHNYVYNINGCV